jgi:hypothetical protein
MATLGRFGLTIDVLQKHLAVRRHRAVVAGTSRVFPVGLLRPTDYVTCAVPGQILSVGVPLKNGQRSRITFVRKAAPPIALLVIYEKSGSVRAICSPSAARSWRG